jgi:creatinine amidohydrolase
MRLQELNWMDVDNYLKTDDRVILVTGATEQHAYLSLMTDVLIAARLADAVAEREKVLVAPPVNFGVSYMFGEFPGTITLSQSTFERVVLEIFESLFHQGFHKFFVMNGHGGNVQPRRLDDFAAGGTSEFVWYDWWKSDAATTVASKHNLSINHANWGENFPFVRVGDSPQGEKTPVDTDQLTERFTAREVLGDGNFGGLYQVDDAIMNEMFDAVVADAATKVRAMKS